MAKEITVDERGRTSLAKVRTRQFDRYTTEEMPDGTLVLTPVITMSAAGIEKARAALAAGDAATAAFLLDVPVEDVERVAGKVDEFLDHPETGTRRSRQQRADEESRAMHPSTGRYSE